LLLEASKQTSDWLVQYHVATGITRIVTTTDIENARAIATARQALAIVLSARPGLANALALSARLDTAEDGHTTRALEDIRRARSISPGREDYIVLESFILMRRSEFAAARQLLVPLTGPSSSPAVRSNARAILDQIALLEQNAADYVAKLEGQRSTTPPAGGSSQGRSSQGRRRTVYRTVEPGEERVEGLLERINCTSAGIDLEINVSGTTERFVAPSMNSVLFISHRSDRRGAIACASRTPPDRVFLTWRQINPAPNPRTVIAVEFLPDER
jgi:hypothetical protein